MDADEVAIHEMQSNCVPVIVQLFRETVCEAGKSSHSHSHGLAGVLSTAGGLVFSGSDEGSFYALNDQTGKALWDFQTGGSIASNPIAFCVDGHQRIAISANRVLYVFGL
jgi:outer membrane protein assembly factor BamB